MTEWVIHYEIAAIIILLALIVLFYAGRKIRTRESRVYIYLVYTTLLMAIFDELATFTLSRPGIVPVWCDYILNIIYNMAAFTVFWLYALYVLYMTHVENQYRKNGVNVLVLPLIIEYILILTTPWTRWIFYIDETNTYHRCGGMAPLMLIGAFYMVFISILCLKKNHFLARIQQAAIIFYTGTALLCIVLQIVLSNYLLNAFAISLGLIMTYISLQGTFVDSDKMLDAYSCEALSKKVEASLEAGKRFYLLMLHMADFDRINVMHGYTVANNILKQVSEYLVNLIPEHQVFHVTGLYFACYIEAPDDVHVESYARRIEDRFAANFRVKDGINDFHIPFCIAMIKCPDQAKSAYEATSIMSSLLEKPNVYATKHMSWVADEMVLENKRREQVGKAVNRAIRNGAFKVYYQPILDIETKKVAFGEALIRLYDEEIGEVSPSEFIPLAEKSGDIGQISNFVLGTVCRFIKSNNPKKLGIKRIGINISAVECAKPGMAERLMSILRSYNIDPGMLSFEVAEISSIADNNNVIDNVVKLAKEGVHFVLDRYGEGYSNVSELINLPFNTIKLDKNILFMASEGDDALSVLTGMAEFIGKLNRKVLMVGVETEEQVEMLEDICCDYVQGFYYSEALDEEAFMEYVSNRNLYGITD